MSSETSSTSSYKTSVALPPLLHEYQSIVEYSDLPHFRIPEVRDVILASFPSSDRIGDSTQPHNTDEQVLPMLRKTRKIGKHLFLISDVVNGPVSTFIYGHKIRSFSSSTVELDEAKPRGRTRLSNNKILNNIDFLIQPPILFAGEAEVVLDGYISALRVGFYFNIGVLPRFMVSTSR